MSTRSQLSLFVPPHSGAGIEAVRLVVDPVQRHLIPAHVTLCREDEIMGLEPTEIASRIARGQRGPVTLQFGAPERFGTHGLLMPCIDGASAFQSLREVVLGSSQIRAHAPHLTLAHPRNPKVPENELESAELLRHGLTLTFDELQLIDQVGAEPWVVRERIPLVTHTSALQ